MVYAKRIDIVVIVFIGIYSSNGGNEHDRLFAG